MSEEGWMDRNIALASSCNDDDDDDDKGVAFTHTALPP